MQAKRKLQLSAAAVIASGMLVLLGTTAPSPAMAASCSDHNDLICWCGPPGYCPTVPGCTVTETCIQTLEACSIGTLCIYQ